MAKSKVINVRAKAPLPDSCVFFKPLWLCWKLLGITQNTEGGHTIGFMFYSVVLNILVTLCYPLHLALYSFRSDTQADNIKNFAVCVTCVACSIKTIVYATKLPIIRRFELILQQLDSRINDGLELEYFMQLKKSVRHIVLIFLGFYLGIGITGEVSFLFRSLLYGDRSLLYPAWFPFNWLESTWKFYLANIYQSFGICNLLMQNFANDGFPPMALCMLSGHIKLLSMRVARIGYDAAKTAAENEQELNRCVVDQNNLYELYTTIENIISLPMFIQFAITATNICLAMAALFFYVSAPLDILYYVVYFCALPFQIYPTCYYGSDFQYLFDQQHRAVFASNWTNQSKTFKKHLMLFTERSLKSHVAMAGGMVRIHLDTFAATCRGAYSLFAIIVQMK